MNKKRKSEIAEVKEAIQELIDRVNEIKDDEEFAMDSVPENLQGSMRYSDMENAVDNMSECIDSLESAVDYLENI